MGRKINNGDKVRITSGPHKGTVGTYYEGQGVHTKGVGWTGGGVGTKGLEWVSPSTPDCDDGGAKPQLLRPGVAKWLADNPENTNPTVGNPYRHDVNAHLAAGTITPTSDNEVMYPRGLGRLIFGKDGKRFQK
jgi:hypothetical protein